MIKKLSLLLFILVSQANFGQNDSVFSLHGKTKESLDRTVLLVQDPLKDKFIDSVKVIENSFGLNTPLTDFPLELILYRDD
ncbi:hypothetical protein [Patiriisocius sp. Uisw_017]|jgi:hypothetical protein|uniref:hypothetical protein n=1 Tax=Patiriisocius sp. Uisw_017 TaxID=3230968 RepID=UPI0039E92EB7